MSQITHDVKHENEVVQKAKAAKRAARHMAALSTDEKNAALHAMADALEQHTDHIVQANAKDIQAAEENNVTGALLDRLTLNEDRVQAMADGLREVATLPDPIGEVLHMTNRPNGLQVGKVRVPLGVVGIIYEARPNVTVDAAGLCLKAGNSVILRGGSEAIHSNTAIAQVIAEAGHEAGLPEGALHLIEDTDRAAAEALMRQDRYIDVLVPRGGPGLIRAVLENATVPVIETGAGNCHVYVSNRADRAMAKDIVFNAKTHRPGVCNAAETLLVHKDIAADVLPEIGTMLHDAGVELRACEQAARYIPQAQPAEEHDWETEYLDMILAIRVVSDVDEAIDHISRYGTGHSEAIVTDDYHEARRFAREVDAAAVFVNASTRFTDGQQFGFGAEIGISTQKLHARGPMGLTELTSVKYTVFGEGHIRK